MTRTQRWQRTQRRRGAEAQRLARAFWITAPGAGEIRDEALPEAGPDEIVVRALYSGISRGTEALVFRGLVPPTEYQRMRAPFQAGALPGPVKYGYSSVGTVERGPRDLEGRAVFALFPHQSRYVVPGADAHLLPPGVPPSRAILAANLETAVNGVWDAELQPGDRADGHRRRRRRLPGRVRGAADDRLRRGAGRHESRARGDCASAGGPLCAVRRRDAGRHRRRARERVARGALTGAGDRGVRSASSSR